MSTPAIAIDWQHHNPSPNAPNPVTGEYLTGFAKGYDDGQLLTEPRNTTGFQFSRGAERNTESRHTYDEYLRIRNTYYAAIHDYPEPTDYSRGYGDGVDAFASEVAPAGGWAKDD
jgi:hypothetical protein